MKIILACRVHPFHRPGGMPFVVHDRACALSELGHEVHVLTTSGIRNIKEVSYELHGIEGGKPEEYSRQYAEGCLKTTQRICPDLIHLDSFHRDQMWWEGRPGGAKGVGITLHGFGFGAFLTRWNLARCNEEECSFNSKDMKAEALALRKADIVIGISNHEHHMLSEFYGLSNTRLVYNPIPDYFFDSPPKQPPPKPVWLCAAISGHEKRGFNTVLNKLKNVDIRVVSNKTREQMVEVYDSCCGVLIPTFYSQGYDLTVAEALARGRRVVASAIGSYRSEEVDYPDNIFLFNCGEWGELAKMLASFTPEYLPVNVEKHRMKNHAIAWLEAMNA